MAEVARDYQKTYRKNVSKIEGFYSFAENIQIMENQANKLSEDMQLFIHKFQPAKFKVLDGRIEIRGMNNIHRSLSEAQLLIERMGLNLEVVHDASMLSYYGFEIREPKI